MAVALVLCGCFADRGARFESSRTLAVVERSPEADGLWAAIQETLRDHQFPLDRVDEPAGVVTTMPVPSQHFFEAWRHDVDTWKDFWEATLNPLRRWVEVQVTPAEDGNGKTLAIIVHKERLSAPDRQFNNSGAAYRVFGERLPSTTGQAKVSYSDERWLDLGRDPAMEAYLLEEMIRRAALSPAVVTSAPIISDHEAPAGGRP